MLRIVPTLSFLAPHVVQSATPVVPFICMSDPAHHSSDTSPRGPQKHPLSAWVREWLVGGHFDLALAADARWRLRCPRRILRSTQSKHAVFTRLAGLASRQACWQRRVAT
jgi:hypothetical protein